MGTDNEQHMKQIDPTRLLVAIGHLRLPCPGKAVRFEVLIELNSIKAALVDIC